MILAVETATKSCSVALLEDNVCIAHLDEFYEDFKHAERLHVLINTLLAKHKLTVSALKGIAVSKGPGSYTGLRIGVSSAKGYAFALNVPLYSFSPLQLMALQAIQKHSISAESTIIAMIDARRDEVYMQCFSGVGEATSEVSNHIVDDGFFAQNKGVYLVGDGAEKFSSWEASKEVQILNGIKPSAQYTAEEVLKLKLEDVAYFEPFYLKDFVATKPKKLV